MPLPVVLLGNKCDLDDTEIDRVQLDKFCEERGFCGWFDTSAKLNINIDNAARFLVERILQHQDIFHKKRPVPVSLYLINNIISLSLLILISFRVFLNLDKI